MLLYMALAVLAISRAASSGGRRFSAGRLRSIGLWLGGAWLYKAITLRRGT